MPDELKPCPFCGGEGFIKPVDGLPRGKKVVWVAFRQQTLWRVMHGFYDPDRKQEHGDSFAPWNGWWIGKPSGKKERAPWQPAVPNFIVLGWMDARLSPPRFPERLKP